MAKSTKKSKRPEKQVKTQSPSFQISDRTQDVIFLVVIAAVLIFLLKPFVIDGLSAQGVDVIASMGSGHQISEYTKETGERALWNPYIFSGMPIYYRHHPVAFSLDNIFRFIGRFISSLFIYYFFAAAGFYLLLRYLKSSPVVAFAATIGFVLMPHFKSLILEGHFAKFRALMILPWVVLSFKYFLDKRTLFSAALFSLAFGLQIRTQHYQIVFYTALLIFAIGIGPFIRLLLDKEYTKFARSTGMLIAALILALGMAAQPLFLAKEYLPYSKRGKTTIDVNQQDQAAQKNADGVSMGYATQWSTHPSEILTWFVPRFYGGMSQEKYDGSEVPRARGQAISGYWGYMPFTQSYEYMGAITLLLAAIGFFFNRKNGFILALAIFGAVLVLLSFGRHLSWFYSLFYHYIPYFNKFRAPMMSVTVNFFVISLFAAYGLNYLAQIKRDTFDWSKQKNLLIILGAFLALGVILWLVGQSFSFVKPNGEPYQGQTLDAVRRIRAEYFNKDVFRYILLILLAAGLIIAYLKKKINFTVAVLLLAVITLVDLANIQARVQKKYINRKKLEKQYFHETSTDRFLRSDSSMFRIFPAGKLFGDNRWAYYHQSIGGYTPIKMYVIEELVEKNIYKGPDKNLPINWNVLKILNVKYVVLQGRVQSPYLSLVNTNAAQNWLTYRFNGFLPRAFFVGEAKIVKNEFDRLKLINSANFDPAKTAIIEEEIRAGMEQPDSAWTRLTAFNPNLREFEVYTDKPALLVLSEVYYPPGWKIEIDGKPVKKIYKTDHAIQSVVVPQGRHTVVMRFEPDSYYSNIRLAWVSVGIIYLIIGSVFFQMFRSDKPQAG